MVAAKLTNEMVGGNRHHRPNLVDDRISNEKAGRMLGVGKSSVINAKTVLKDGTPEEIDAVEKGEAGWKQLGKFPS